jgi:hypothetical protein
VKYAKAGITWFMAYWFDATLSSAVPLLYEVNLSSNEKVTVPPLGAADVAGVLAADDEELLLLLPLLPVVAGAAAVVLLELLLLLPHAAAIIEAPSRTTAAFAAARVFLKLSDLLGSGRCSGK